MQNIYEFVTFDDKITETRFNDAKVHTDTYRRYSKSGDVEPRENRTNGKIALMEDCAKIGKINFQSPLFPYSRIEKMYYEQRISDDQCNHA